VKVWWRSGHLSARRSDLRKSLQTDRWTDNGRLAIALAHSWNELKMPAWMINNANPTIHEQKLSTMSTSAEGIAVKKCCIKVSSHFGNDATTQDRRQFFWTPSTAEN